MALILFLTTELMHADWLCTEAASQRRGSKIFACGIGNGVDENTARLNAFDNAKIEFSRLCDSSDDCSGHKVSVQPERTSCLKEAAAFKCYRLIVFTILESVRPKSPSRAASENPVAAGDAPESFDAFSYAGSKDFPKLAIGMKKSEVLALFGAPESTGDSDDTYRVLFFYRGKMCVYGSLPCTVWFEKGIVVRYKDFKPIYTEDLK